MRDLQELQSQQAKKRNFGQVAQSVEQRIENPRVGSSILPLATMISQRRETICKINARVILPGRISQRHETGLRKLVRG